MTKLTGTSVQRPRLRTAYNLWGPANRCFVDPIFHDRVRDDNVPATRQAALRSAIYKELFDELPNDERQEWIKKAEEEHQAALAKVSIALKNGASEAPEDRQRYIFSCVFIFFRLTNVIRVIESLSGFVEPILDLIAEHTGWKITLIAGGPEPADGGRLNIVRSVVHITRSPLAC